jgi:nitrogen permease regulator 2-like protein
LLTISLDSLTSPISSDLTLLRIIPYIDGINSVSKIVRLADTDLSLTRKALQHLVYYGCLILLDIFSFGAIYAPTAEIGGFIMDENVQEECARYVRMPRMTIGSKSVKMGSESERSRDDRSSMSSETARSPMSGLGSTETDSFPPKPDEDDDEFKIPHDTLITLYTSLRQGLTLHNFVLDNLTLLNGIDIRRFITFGVIKGFLYRVHKYVISTSTSTSSSVPPAPPASLQSRSQAASHHSDSDRATVRGTPHLQHLHHKPSLASTAHTTSTHEVEEGPRLDSILSEDDGQGEDRLPLVKFLDGMHCFDDICTELGLSEKKVEEKVKGAGDVQIFWR